MGAATLRHLESLYGGRAAEVARLAAGDQALARPLAPEYPDIAAQVVFAARTEQCVRLSDFLLRRTLLGFSPDQGTRAVAAAAAVMARELRWTPVRTAAEIEAYREWIAGTQAFRSGGDRAGESPPEVLRQ
jgi:glycerol-3-phosphate dehydrogenase